jgi:hypothetical protein
MLLELVSITFRIAISRTTGAEMVVMRRRIEAAKRRKVPTWWSIPVWCRAILFICAVRLLLLVRK